ncbi:MAG TPA: redoxin domain-containing protein [Gaiellales bacterium]|jgi:peroxiredoxin|nr:redoxin domain-containing protein [Gaiellales bacterium]
MNERDYRLKESDYRREYPDEILGPGTPAPPFDLQVTPDQRAQLSEFRGRNLVMAFYPADWSPVCGDQLALYNEALPEFERLDANLVGVSVDGAWCHDAYAASRNLHFPLLADFEPKGGVSKRYGAYEYGLGMSKRALFVLDGEGTIRWSNLSPMAVNPGVGGILTALESMASVPA